MKITPKMEELVSSIIADMEKGEKLPWNEPWFYTAMRNWKTERPYSGINTLSLAFQMSKRHLDHGQFLTYKQAQDVKAQVKKGEHGFPVFFFKPLRVKDKTTGEEDTIPLMRTYIVFSVDQMDGIAPKPDKTRDLNQNDLGDKIIKESKADIHENVAEMFSPAYYSHHDDFIAVPKRNLWKTDEGYYSTIFHELTHWTSKKDRCNRDLTKYSSDKKERAFEELVAELGGAFLSAYCGFKYDTQHSAYISSWVSLLKDHKDALYLAASKAQKAVNFILTLAGLIEAKKEEIAA